MESGGVYSQTNFQRAVDDRPSHLIKDCKVFKMASVKKFVKSKGQLRNGCDGIG